MDRPGLAEDGLARGLLMLLCLLVIPPLAFIAFGAFRNVGPGAPGAEFTLENWEYVLRPIAVRTIANSLMLGTAASALAIAAGLLMAWLLVRTDMPTRRQLSTLVIVPLLFSPLLTSVAYVGIGGPNAGIVNVLAKNLPGVTGPLVDIYSVAGMVFVLFLHYAPYAYLGVRAALLNVDPDLEEASQVLGANVATTLRRVTLPLIRPMLFGSALLVFVFAAEDFSAPAILGVGIGFPTLPYAIYENVAEYPAHPTRAAALGMVLFLLMLIAISVYLWSIRSGARYVSVSGKGARSSLVRLGRPLKIAAIVYVLGYFLAAVALPYGVLVIGSFSSYFATSQFDISLLTLRHYQNFFTDYESAVAIRNTVTLMLVGATVATLLAAFVSRVAVRSRYRWRHLLEYLSTAPIFMPGAVLGLGLFWTYVFVPTGLYGTTAILLIAFVTRFFGHGTRVLSPALLQVSREFEEAAQTLGSSRLQAFIRITIPMLRTPLASAWVLIAIFISMELAASIFLYSSSSITGSLLVFRTMSSGTISTAFTAGAVFATATFVIIAVAQWRLRALDKL